MAEMSAAVIEVSKLQSGSDTLNSRMKMWMGVVRGRTPKAGTTKARTQKKIISIKYYKLQLSLRGGARSWGKDPSFPQTDAVPEHPPSGGKCEEKHRT